MSVITDGGAASIAALIRRVGYAADGWAAASVNPDKEADVNLEGFDPIDGIKVIVGDACDLRDTSGDFDLVYSKPLIEHVGG